MTVAVLAAVMPGSALATEPAAPAQEATVQPSVAAPKPSAEAMLRRQMTRRLTRAQDAQLKSARKNTAAALSEMRTESSAALEQALGKIREENLSAE